MEENRARKNLFEDRHTAQALSHRRTLLKILSSTVTALMATLFSLVALAGASATATMHISLIILPCDAALNTEGYEPEPEPEPENIFTSDGISFTQDSSGEYTAYYDSSEEIENRDYSISTEFDYSEIGTDGILNLYISVE